MKYPKFLAENGTIGFVAPSFGCNIEPYKTAFDNAQKCFRELGHGLDLGPNCYAGSGIGISNTPEACGTELTEYYCSAENDMLISCGGGELMCETMNHVDFEKIKAAEPKWYMGYSDNTNMTFLLATLCDTASIYGPCAQTFGMEPWHESLHDTYQLLRGQKNVVHGYDMWEKDSLKDAEHPLVSYHLTEKRDLRIFTGKESGKMAEDHTQRVETAAAIEKKIAENGYSGREYPDLEIQMQGRLIGGCMDCLINLLGTKFDKVEDFAEKYKEDGIIWFMESCELNVMSIRRAIWQMKNAGWFSHVKGFLIGRPLCFGENLMGLDQYHAIVDLLAEYHVPIIMDADIGHLAPMMPLVCGGYAKIQTKGNDITVEMQWK